MEYLEVEQDDLTDSQMLDVIREKMMDEWACVGYKYDDGIKTFLFEREEAFKGKIVGAWQSLYGVNMEGYELKDYSIPVVGE